MKANLDAKRLLAVSKVIRSVVSTLKNEPYVLATVNDNNMLRIEVRGQNNWAQAELECETVEPGAVAMPANLICDLPARCEEEIALDATNGWYVANCGAYKVEGPTVADLQPYQCPQLPEKIAIVKSGEEFKSALRMALAILNEKQPAAFGDNIRLTIEDGGLAIASTDGKRLLKYYVPAYDTIATEEQILIPKAEAARMASLRLSGTAEVFASDSLIAVRDCSLNATLIASRGAGKYPPIEKVLNVQRKELAHCYCDVNELKNACWLMRASGCNYKIELTINDKNLKIAGQTTSGGEAVFETSVAGEGNGRVSLNWESLATFLGATEDEGDVYCIIYEDGEPFTIYVKDRWVYLQMPIVVQQED